MTSSIIWGAASPRVSGPVPPQFDENRRPLLDILRAVHKSGPSTLPFVEDGAEGAWTDIRYLASNYPGEKRFGASASDREKDYRALATQLIKARSMTLGSVSNADLGHDLIMAWSQQTNADGYFRDKSEFDASLKAALNFFDELARAATVSAEEARLKTSGTSAIPLDFVENLAIVFRSHTGCKPGAGLGPFQNFVSTFLAAMDRGLNNETVVDAIKNARTEANSRMSGSPFRD